MRIATKVINASVLTLASMMVGPTIAQAGEKEIKERLKTMLPGAVDQAEISPAKIPGLYQIKLGLSVAYMSADGKYLLDGSMVDLETGNNLTRQVKNQARKTALAKIPTESMIVYPAQEEKQHTVTIFTDIDCPYCKKLHKEIPTLTQAGVEVRYLAYPRTGVGSASYKKAVSVWCADSPSQAMNGAMQGQKVASTTCKNPVKSHMGQAQRFEVNGTPNIILDNGTVLPGYVPAKEMLALLKKQQ